MGRDRVLAIRSQVCIAHTAHRSIGSVLGFANHGARGRAPSHNPKPKT